MNLTFIFGYFLIIIINIHTSNYIQSMEFNVTTKYCMYDIGYIYIYIYMNRKNV